MVTSSLTFPLTAESYASLSRRIRAYLVDLVISFALFLLVPITLQLLRALGLWIPAQGTGEEVWARLGGGSKLLVLLAYFLSLGLVYRIIFEASPWQATFGKRLVHIYVGSEGGARISYARSTGRSLAKAVLGIFGGAFISAVTIAATGKHRALHDFLADTVVINGRVPPENRLSWWHITAAFVLPLLVMLAVMFAVTSA